MFNSWGILIAHYRKTPAFCHQAAVLANEGLTPTPTLL